MVDPVSQAILTLVCQIGKAALTARQNRKKCRDLAGRAKSLGDALPNFAGAAAGDAATVHGLQRLKDALNDAFELIRSCQEGRLSGMIFSCVCSSPVATEFDTVDRRINNCLSDLNFFVHARATPQHPTVKVSRFSTVLKFLFAPNRDAFR